MLELGPATQMVSKAGFSPPFLFIRYSSSAAISRSVLPGLMKSRMAVKAVSVTFWAARIAASSPSSFTLRSSRMASFTRLSVRNSTSGSIFWYRVISPMVW